MSVCPIPFNLTQTDYTSPGAFVANPPDARFEICIGGSSTVIGSGSVTTITVCCPSPGPAGPVGPAGCGIKFRSIWEAGKQYYFEDGDDACETSLVVRDAVLYVAKASHTSDSTNEPGVGASWASVWDIFGSAQLEPMVWQGLWETEIEYQPGHTVRGADGNAYVCVAAHTSGEANKPETDTEFNFWEPATDLSLAEGDKSLLDALTDSVFDWIKTAVAAGDWLSLLAAGVGVAVAGAAILDLIDFDGVGDGQADSRYDGTAGYSGSFTAPSLQQVVASIMQFGGYASDRYDVSLLPSREVHFTVDATVSCRQLLAQLALAYQFDIVPSGSVVKFVPKYIAPVRTLTSADLGHVQVTDGPAVADVPYTMKRMQGIELPRSVTLNYYSSDLDHNVFTQVATLETYEHGQDVKLEVPFTLSDVEAKRIVETALVNAHIEQQQITFVSDVYNLDLEPADVVTVPLDTGGTIDIRITQQRSTQDGLIEFVGNRSDFNTTSYTSSGVEPVEVPAQPSNVPGVIGYSGVLFIEVPPLNDSTDKSPRILAAVHGYGVEGWPGAALFRSVDGGSSYASQLVSTLSPTIGIVRVAPLAPRNNNYFVWDNKTTIDVELKQGQLTSAASDLAVQNGINWCMIGEEVIGFRYAQLIGAGTYRISRLLRGRQGSELKINTHVPNELFVLLDNQLNPIQVQPSDFGKIVKYKPVTIGSDISKSTAVDLAPYGLNMRPWKPAKVKAELQANGDWLITWIERPRYENSLRDYTEITHDPDWAGYAVGIKNGATFVHTATSIVDSYTYTVEQQIEDFGSPQTTLTGQVVQMSTIVGGGYAGQFTA